MARASERDDWMTRWAVGYFFISDVPKSNAAIMQSTHRIHPPHLRRQI